MDSSARFKVGEGYAVYRGPAADSAVHSHAAFQVAIAAHGEVRMVDAAGARHRGTVLVVAPMVRHRMLATAHLVTFFVEPQCVFAGRLRRRYGGGIANATELHAMSEGDLGPASMRPAGGLDPRLLRAMDTLRGDAPPMAGLAAAVGLSPQRLRALAQAQLGMPLARWRVWARLRRAAEALQRGRSPADAAAEAGFTDQAHLTRRMREMIGLTPAAVVAALGTHPPAAAQPPQPAAHSPQTVAHPPPVVVRRRGG
ncbi:helix-turn-helix domain-containing protein [Dactylosporangium sp. NPDC000521]|uniref:AraC family transcriptional regulator n=1 Tax=Dactylosporangium sp. NPDC000521 TaxID=3363975 RepID=UPI00367EE5A4